MDLPKLSMTALLVGAALDLAFGDPSWLPHPVVGFGSLIASGERLLNRDRGRFWKGLALTVLLVGGVFTAGWHVERLLHHLHPLAWFSCTAAIVFFCLAHRTLLAEALGVEKALREDGLEAGRKHLSRIVGRDTERLTEQEVRAAVLETLSENLSDGVVAPLFWFALGGPVAMLTYKMVNTLDSMIGYRNERYEAFGKAAARLDDLANFIPARLTGLLLALLSARPRAFSFLVRFGRAHASPNSGYPEAALAGILDVRLGGPHDYGGRLVPKPWIGVNSRSLTPADVTLACRMNHRAAAAALALVLLSVMLKTAVLP